MPELETQLRRYGELLDEQYPDVSIQEIGAWARDELALREPPRLRRGLAVALAAAVAVLLMVGGSTLLLFQGEEHPVMTTPDHFPSTTPVTPTLDPPTIGPGARASPWRPPSAPGRGRVSTGRQPNYTRCGMRLWGGGSDKMFSSSRTLRCPLSAG